MNAKENSTNIGLAASSNEFIMLNKKERRLLRALLSRSLDSKAGREFIARRLGEEYLEVGESLLNEMGGDTETL